MLLFLIFRQNLALMKEINDTAAQGRACGNLGNTYYLLGNFKQAIYYHQEVCNVIIWVLLYLISGNLDLDSQVGTTLAMHTTNLGIKSLEQMLIFCLCVWM